MGIQRKRPTPEQRANARERKAYVAEIGYCVINGRPADQVHEMLGGSNKQITVKDPRFWLPTNWEGHRILQNLPKPAQLALKLKHDAERFDLERFNEVYRSGGLHWPVTLKQIAEYIDVVLST